MASAVGEEFLSVAFVIIVTGEKKKKKKRRAYASVFPKSFPVLQIFGHLWSKSQFSAISRGPSRLVLAGNRGGQQGPCRETRRFLGLDEDCGKSPALSTRGRQEPR